MKMEQAKRENTCGNCGACASDNSGNSFCHARPPQVSIVAMPQEHPITHQVSMGLQQMAAWPPVQPHQWCLAWGPKSSPLLVQ